MKNKTLGQMLIKAMEKKKAIMPVYCQDCLFYYEKNKALPICLHKKNLKIISNWKNWEIQYKKRPSVLNEDNACLRYIKKMFFHFPYVLLSLVKRMP